MTYNHDTDDGWYYDRSLGRWVLAEAPLTEIEIDEQYEQGLRILKGLIEDGKRNKEKE